jgi:hypothetical protein
VQHLGVQVEQVSVVIGSPVLVLVGMLGRSMMIVMLRA